MVEVLVTLFILSIGLLGVASLQFVSAFSNADALNRSQSLLVAQQFGERLRASASLSATGSGLVVHNDYFKPELYNFANLSCPDGGTPEQCYCLALPATIPDCQSTLCSAAQFAVFDTYEVSCAATSANPIVKIGLSCEDNNPLDGDLCSVGSRQRIILSWPIENWQGNQGILNPDCNVDQPTAHACIILEPTL
ncbi:MAG: type IV pilus assembly protein PilV [Paraglaciecola sp.]|jgi:type IV pilus assembly protein PilV